MSIFVVFRVLDSSKLEAALTREFPDDHRKLADGQYLVSSKGSAKAVSDKLGISDNTSGAAIVFKMLNYFGRAPADIWDWIKVKAEQTDG